MKHKLNMRESYSEHSALFPYTDISSSNGQQHLRIVIPLHKFAAVGVVSPDSLIRNLHSRANKSPSLQFLRWVFSVQHI